MQQRIFLSFGLGLALAFAVSLGVILGRRLPMSDRSSVIAVTSELLRRVQDLNQLVTVRYVIEKVVLLEDVKWYGENRVLMVVHGHANAGIDLSRVQPQHLEVKGRSILLRLPSARLLDVYLDDRRSQVVERSTGLLREFDKDLEQNARRQALDTIRVTVRDSGILREAEERARRQLETLFRAAGFESVTFKGE